jgi:hypothetical protein
MKKIKFKLLGIGSFISKIELINKELDQTVVKFKNKKGGYKILKRPLIYYSYSGMFSCLLVLLIFTFMAASCEKQEELNPQETVNVTLYDKDTVTIQNYIQGKWNVIYAKGGISVTNIQYFDSCTVEFTADKKYISNSYGRTETYIYYWHKELEVYADSVYVMFPRLIIFDKIKNDTLIYSDALMSEPMHYYLVNLKN